MQRLPETCRYMPIALLMIFERAIQEEKRVAEVQRGAQTEGRTEAGARNKTVDFARISG